MPQQDLSGFANYEAWAAANRAAGGKGLRSVYDAQISGGAVTPPPPAVGGQPGVGAPGDPSPATGAQQGQLGGGGNQNVQGTTAADVRNNGQGKSEDYARFSDAELND